jgi:hypothetical protein
LLALYPRWWRERYADEMQALLELAPIRPRDRLDLIRGALDAWLHPPLPSWIPGAAALVGGGLWTVLAAGVLAQPVPPDWPGYLLDVVPLAILSGASLFVAFVGLAIRAADAAPRAAIMAVALLAVGFGSWLAALLATAVGIADGATLGAAQALAMIGAIAIGILLIRVGDDRLGVLAVIGSGVMFVPWTGSWLIAGAAWTAIGIDLLVQWAQPQNGRQVVP